MRFSKKYLVFAAVILLALFGKLNNWSDRYAAVETFRGATLKDEVFYPLMSKNINDSGALRISINGEAYSNAAGMVMLDGMMQPVVSLDFIKDVLRGCVYREDDLSITLQSPSQCYEFLLDNPTALKNGDNYELKTSPSEFNSQAYIGFEDICDIYGFDYSYDNNTQLIEVEIKKYPELPRKFDLRDYDRISLIRDQGTNSTCWACASLGAMESTMRPYDSREYSLESMLNDNSFKLSEKAGGDYTMALAYLLSWQGPQIEGKSKLLGDLVGNDETKPVHLQEVRFYDAEDLDKIKSAVYRYGGVSTSIYAKVSTSNLASSSSYNRHTNSYCYLGNNQPNHDVVIVGWDDDYPASRFTNNIPGDGAFICQNSWGSDFGESGVFYISYYDTNIGKQSVSYTKIDTAGRYSDIYQSDLCGWVGQIGYHKQWGYGANVFTARENQQIEATGFYALRPNTAYKVFVVPKYENLGSFGKKVSVAEGAVSDAGFYTIAFNRPIDVEKDSEFAIIVYVNSPDTDRPIALEYQDKKLKSAADITDGKGYISNNGLDWERVEDVASANLCIKAYANKKVEVLE